MEKKLRNDYKKRTEKTDHTDWKFGDDHIYVGDWVRIKYAHARKVEVPKSAEGKWVQIFKINTRGNPCAWIKNVRTIMLANIDAVRDSSGNIRTAEESLPPEDKDVILENEIVSLLNSEATLIKSLKEVQDRLAEIREQKRSI